MDEVIIDLRDQFRDKSMDVVLQITDTFEIRLAIVGGDVGHWSAMSRKDAAPSTEQVDRDPLHLE